MRLPKYRLQTLLDMRERAEREAQDQMVLEQKKLSREEKKLEELKEEKRQKIQARLARRDELTQEMRQGKMTVQTIQEEYRFLDRMAEEIRAMDDLIVAQKQAVVRQQLEVDAAREVLLEKSKELKALEKHREKWEIQAKKEIQRKQELTAEDVAQTIFMFNKNR